MDYKQIEQMSAQMYNKIGFCPNFVGVNHKSSHLKSLLPMLSRGSMSAVLYFSYGFAYKQRILDRELCLQTLFRLDWHHLLIPQSKSVIKSITKELKDNNIALRLSNHIYVVNIDVISAFTLPQRKRYIDIITEANRTVNPKGILTGSANPLG